LIHFYKRKLKGEIQENNGNGERGTDREDREDREDRGKQTLNGRRQHLVLCVCRAASSDSAVVREGATYCTGHWTLLLLEWIIHY